MRDLYRPAMERKMYPRSMILPAFTLYSVLFILPTIIGIYYAFTNWNTFSPNIRFIGLQNFRVIFIEQPFLYLRPITNTFLFAVVTSLFKVIIGLGIALMLNGKMFGKNTLRTIFFVPLALSPIVIGILFTTILSPNGLLNNFLGAVGLEVLQRRWLITLATAMPSVMSVEIWRAFGLNMVIFLAGLQSIDPTYYEAARIDGANAFQLLRKVTIPFIMPAITINLVLNMVHGFRAFDIVLALTNGGPGNATELIATMAFREFSVGNNGFATAMNLVLLVMTTIVAALVSFLSGRKEVAY